VISSKRFTFSYRIIIAYFIKKSNEKEGRRRKKFYENVRARVIKYRKYKGKRGKQKKNKKK
jgi:hypothetical protein